MLDGLFDISLDTMNLDLLNVRKAGEEEQKREEIRATCEYTPGLRHIFKKIKGPSDLMKQLPDWDFANGDCYHAVSIANVDSLSWMKAIAERQNIRYMLLSTYALYGKAVEWMDEMQATGHIGRIDFYLSDDIERKHPEVYPTAKKLLLARGGRLVIFRNHSKVIAIKGEDFDVLIESSANINEHIIPHFEQTCLTVDSKLVEKEVNRFGTIWPDNKTTFAEPMKFEESDKNGPER